MQNRKEYVDAPFFTRLIAFLIDQLLITIAFYLGGSVLLFFEFFQTEVLFHYTILDLLKYAVTAVYFVGMTYSGGRTLGKIAMGICVVSTTEETPSFLDILFRETIGRFLSGLAYIGYILALGSSHRALHDLLSDTRVVYYGVLAEKRIVYRKRVEPPAPAPEADDAEPMTEAPTESEADVVEPMTETLTEPAVVDQETQEALEKEEE